MGVIWLGFIFHDQAFIGFKTTIFLEMIMNVMFIGF